MHELRHFLALLTGPKIVKVGILSGFGLIAGALIDAVVFLDILDKFTRSKAIEAAVLLRLGYESTLIFIGYIILLLALLKSILSLLRNDTFKPDAQKLQIQFIILLAFIISFFVARIFVILLDLPSTPTFELWLKGYRIHHFFYGIGLTVVGGWLGHTHSGRSITRVSAALYGTGFGLIVDEFGLLLTFGDYWSAQSYLFFVLISLLLLFILLSEAYKIVNRVSF
ncbi:MAG: hypothetical protein EFT35_09670 [Methanophagales archaeon ANME-1-THS]|nr:MAG: hypothetical protein EFT35_09670 [Methanophagales archaeon ANME-1-THS]